MRLVLSMVALALVVQRSQASIVRHERGEEKSLTSILALSAPAAPDDVQNPQPPAVPSVSLDARTEPKHDIYDLAPIQPASIPKLTRAQKWALIRASGQDPMSRRRREGKRVSVRKQKRDLLLAPWRITHMVPQRKAGSPRRSYRPAVALPVDYCPEKFDAVTRGYNGRTYMFARDRVYQMWYEDDLPQKASFLISELFQGGPRRVTAALTNSRSGVTILMEGRRAFRFRWNRKNKRFQLAKNTPLDLPRNITITPSVGFEWMDGNQVLLQNDEFFTYDAYWNLATYSGKTARFFPNVPRGLIGVTYNGGDTALMFTNTNSIKVYDAKKFRVVQEYPVRMNEYVGCIRKK